MVILARGLGSPVQAAKNPWKRGGFYYRGRLAPWIGNPAALRPKQKAITSKFASVAKGCAGTTGKKAGVTNMALCVRKGMKGAKA